MAKKLNAKKRAKFEEQQYVEDLDLDVEEPIEDEEDYVAHNRRQRTGVSKHTSAALPSDAHRMDGYGDEEYGFAEEHSLAEQAAKEMRKAMGEDDFLVPGVQVGEDAKKKKPKALPSVLMDDPVIESIERDFAALSSSERLAILIKEAPELMKMLDDLKNYLEQVKALTKPLHELLHERKVVSEGDQHLIAFLETKVQLMLSYCMHVTFYLLLKCEGKKVANHPVIDTLVEIRTYLEKMWPLEEKLQYSLQRLLSGKSMSAVEAEQLRPVQEVEGLASMGSRGAVNTEASERRRLERAQKDADELEKEELASMTRVQSKRATQLNSLRPSAVDSAPLSYRENEDQFFTRLAGREESDEDEEGLSLMETLRRRQAALDKQRQPEEKESDNDEAFEEEEFEEDMQESDLKEENDTYEELLASERKRSASDHKPVPRGSIPVEEVARRHAGKKIESHRGLTKARPKDRKNPRVAQRRKYERGMRVHKTQTRSHQPEEEGGFTGVRSIKPGVVRSRPLS